MILNTYSNNLAKQQLAKTYSFKIDKGVTDWMKFIAALTVVIHHYSQYAVHTLNSANTIYLIFSYMGGLLGLLYFSFSLVMG